MRILLAHNSLYYPSFGGGDKSNRLLMEALAERGHSVRVVARVENFGTEAHEKLAKELHRRGLDLLVSQGEGIQYVLNGVDVCTLSRNSHFRAYFSTQIRAFDPDVILTSTDDPAHILLHAALRSVRARVVYLIRATVAAPFGPDSAMPSIAKTEALRRVDGTVGVGEYVADYARKWANLAADHVPISLLDRGEYPALGRFDNRYITMVNPCAVKGLSIFLALADCLPSAEFAAVPTWGTTSADIDALRKRPNIAILPPVDNIDEVLRQTRILLVPSIWAEARSRMILEGMSRGIPVIASDVGGLREAKLGVDYLLPVNPVVRYPPEVDELMVPAAEVPEQDAGPWKKVVERLITDRAHYQQLSAESRRVALDYAATLNVLPFENYLLNILRKPRRRDSMAHAHIREGSATTAAARAAGLSPEKRRLLTLRLKSQSRPAVGKPPSA